MLTMLSVFCLVSFAQSSVTGIVKDKTGEPIVGASILIKGTSTGTVTDINGGKTTATLSVKYGQNVAPSIVWVGYDIDKRQTYAAGMTCDLIVKAPLAIADFKVNIISETLNADQLTSVGLASEFSLVNDTQFFESLGGLGFPTGDAVYGQSEVNLSISNFLSVLAMLGPGEHDFEMSVTDKEGNTTTKTVMFRFN